MLVFVFYQDLEDFGMDKVIEMALEAAWDGCDAVYMSCEFRHLRSVSLLAQGGIFALPPNPQARTIHTLRA